MRAIGVTEYGGPDVLHAVELPERHAGAGEVRIRVKAATVNPVDVMIRSGVLAGGPGAEITEPVVPGMDVSGTIDEIGPDQPAGFDLRVGDAVSGFVAPHGSHGGYSESIVLPSASVTRMPSRLGFEEGASFLANALTAELTLEALALQPGQTLAVTGATGAVGGYLTEFASQRGVRVIAAAAREDHALLQALGADTVLDRERDFVAGVLEATDGRGADALADPAILVDGVVDAIRDGGQVAFYLPNSVEPGRGIRTFVSFVMGSNLRHDLIEALGARAERGEVTIRVADTYPAADAAAAHARLERGGLRGRLVLQF